MTNPPATHPNLIPVLQPTLRASDSDREQAANLLRDHYADGRIAPDELAERLDHVYRAGNLGDLQAPFDDLPTRASSTLINSGRPLSARLPRRVIAIPIAAAVATLAAVTDAHLLWLAWPLLTIAGPRHRHPRGRRNVAAVG